MQAGILNMNDEHRGEKFVGRITFGIDKNDIIDLKTIEFLKQG